MSVRNSARAAVCTLAVLGSGLFAGAAGASAQAASCGLETLGSGMEITLSNGTNIGLYYLGFNTCNGNVYSEVHFSTSLTIVQNGSDSISVYNRAGGGGTNHAAPTNVTSSTYWTSPMELNTLDASQTRVWYGETEFDFTLNGAQHACSALTNYWNFSNGSVYAAGSYECDGS